MRPCMLQVVLSSPNSASKIRPGGESVLDMPTRTSDQTRDYETDTAPVLIEVKVHEHHTALHPPCTGYEQTRSQSETLV